MTHTISVVGVGAAALTPDAAQIRCGVEVTRDTVAQALADLAERSGAALQTLTAAGIPASAVVTDAINVGPSYSQEPGKPERYVASQLLTVRLGSMAAVGDIVAALGDAVGDALRVHHLSPIALDAEATVRAAREAAFAAAREEAQHLASLAGRELGRVLRIAPSDDTAFGGGGARMEVMASKSIPMGGGERDVSCVLKVTWEMAEGPVGGPGNSTA